MKRSFLTSCAAILVLSATTATAQQKMYGMKTIPMGKPAAGQTVHVAKRKVTKVDTGANVVTLAHEPVKSSNWPAMTMGFQVKDKTLLDKPIVGRTVDFEFTQGDKAYVIADVK